MQTTDIGGKGVPSIASQCAWASQHISAVLDSELTPTIAQPTPQVSPLARLGFPRRFSETDDLHAMDMQNTLLSTYTPILYPATSTASPQFMNMTVMKSSSPPQGCSLPPMPMNNDDYFQLSQAPSPCSEEDSICASSAPGSPPAVTQFHPQMADYQPAQQPISPSPTHLKTEGVQRRARKRRYVKQPKDLKATRRLQGQRKSDNENIEALRKLFVPNDAEVRWKKDRLGTSTSEHSFCRWLLN